MQAANRHRAAYYTERAARARASANAMGDQAARAVLLRVADALDDLADIEARESPPQADRTGRWDH
jgi:hypothetical protein